MSVVAGRYAKALLDLAIAESAVDEYQSGLTAVSRIVETEKDLRSFLLSPRNEPAAKKRVILHVFGGLFPQNILNLLLLVLEKGRMESLPDIAAAYVQMADEYRNIVQITVTTALPLNSAQIGGIGKKFKTMYHGSSVKITVKTDPSLIGGVKVAVGDRLYDGTIKGKLLKMKSAVAVQ